MLKKENTRAEETYARTSANCEMCEAYHRYYWHLTYVSAGLSPGVVVLALSF